MTPAFDESVRFRTHAGAEADISDVYMMFLWTPFWIQDVRGFWWEVTRNDPVMHKRAWTFTGQTRAEEVWDLLLGCDVGYEELCE